MNISNFSNSNYESLKKEINYNSLKKDLTNYSYPHNLTTVEDREKIDSFYRIYPQFRFGTVLNKSTNMITYLIYNSIGEAYILYIKYDSTTEYAKRIDISEQGALRLVFFNEQYILYQIEDEIIPPSKDRIHILNRYFNLLQNMRRNMKDKAGESWIIGNILYSIIHTRNSILFCNLENIRHGRIEEDIASLAIMYNFNNEDITDTILFFKEKNINIDKVELKMKIQEIGQSLIDERYDSNRQIMELFKNCKMLSDAKTSSMVNKYVRKYLKMINKQH